MSVGYHSMRFLLGTDSTAEATSNFHHSKRDNWEVVPIRYKHTQFVKMAAHGKAATMRRKPTGHKEAVDAGQSVHQRANPTLTVLTCELWEQELARRGNKFLNHLPEMVFPAPSMAVLLKNWMEEPKIYCRHHMCARRVFQRSVLISSDSAIVIIKYYYHFYLINKHDITLL